MKSWDASHPKAKLMARKRAAILTAARTAFLKSGYEGTSMEAIAAGAGVSIMTLYRHAETKDDLFAAVIANACDASDEQERAAFASLLKKPLGEILLVSGVWAQQRLSNPETIALLRAVVAETTRFPQLAEMAYSGLIGHLEAMMAHVLAAAPDSRALSSGAQKKLAALFVDRLVGTDLLRVLLGLPGMAAAHRERRAAAARDEVLAAIRAGRTRRGD